MNKRILIWLIIFYPVGLYLLFKEKKKSRSDTDSIKSTPPEPSEIENQCPEQKQDLNASTKQPDPQNSFFHSNSGTAKLVQFCLKASMWLMPWFLITKFLIIPALGGIEAPGTETIVESISFIYLFGVIPWFCFPRHRKKIIIFFSVLPFLFLLGEFGPDPDEMESLWFQVPFYVVGLGIWFVVLGVLAKRSNNPQIKKYAQGRLLKKDELILVGTFAIASIILGLGFAVWYYGTTISDFIPFLSGLPNFAIMDLVPLISGVLGFILIVIGNLILTHPDTRFSTWVRDTVEPKVIIGTCFVLGVPLLLYGVLY